MIDIPPGAIVAFKAGGFIGWLMKHVLAPETDRFHFLIVRGWVSKIGDYEFIESNNSGLFPKGIQHGYLYEKYRGADVEIYEVNCPAQLKRRAPLELMRYGRTAYDFLMAAPMVLQLPGAVWRMLWQEHRIRKITALDFTYTPDNVFSCVEAVWVAYNSVGVPIIPPNVMPLPSEFRRALWAGRLTLLYKGKL